MHELKRFSRIDIALNLTELHAPKHDLIPDILTYASLSSNIVPEFSRKCAEKLKMVSVFRASK
jgi:hypothetical protein